MSGAPGPAQPPPPPPCPGGGPPASVFRGVGGGRFDQARGHGCADVAREDAFTLPLRASLRPADSLCAASLPGSLQKAPGSIADLQRASASSEVV
ncbi:hypothetical protein SKAU_G00359870 [Synaphobranchus kaupii]|uniref:Uncharacterized protein n=1 Tax=Synaphobranchus kaupii TaxID=118154 RepID=A0A9Q1EI19_SYNKA|nr:hypothetical protein SKAU_G00359870 [Synaphobranchus kaupii]